MDDVAEDVLTEAAAVAELVTWVSERPVWQRDALRRLVLKDELDETDIAELTIICLNPKSPSDPITTAHSGDTAASAEAVSLLRIEKPTGINALVSDQTLTFAPKGLTIIYGDNGSGKSGYVRVLKHACRTRDRETAILRDIGDTVATPQTASIVFARGATEETFAWAPANPGHPELPSVSIFDSRSANIHVEKTNAVAYIPRPMKLLESLASVCDLVKEKLEAQLVALSAQTPLALKTPTLKAETAAGAFVHSLSAKTNLSQLALLAVLSPEETQRLAALESDLAQDPKKAALRVLNQKSRLDEQIAKLKKVTDAASSGAFTARDTAKTLWKTKTEAAQLASGQLFAASPLPDIGQATWLSLWEAARKYSNEKAYPSKTFPETDTGDLCVLCQQPLSPEAIERKQTFENFVKGTTKADEDSASLTYHSIISTAKAARFSMRDVIQLDALINTEIGDEPLAVNVKRYAVAACWRWRALTREKPQPALEVPTPATEIAALSTGLGARAAQLSADQASPAYLALLKEHNELKDRAALAPLVEDIKAEVERRKNADAINKALKDTAKKAVTTKNKDMSDKLVTNALRGRFAREIEKLKLSRMPVELRKTKDQNAISYFQVCLVESPSKAVGEIFSEGEHRCVALAAFLAELVTAKRYSGIVFDDPMSSLDHIHRKAVAARLVEEAAHRRVVVFTHDLTFLFELRREAEAKDIAVHYQTILRRQSRPGHVDSELPNKAKSAGDWARGLRSELKAVKGQLDTWAESKRSIFCKGFIEQLREAWDQGIADFIFPVIGRFDNTIKGTSLFKLAILTEEDVKTVTAARGRLSEDLHASSETLNPEMVKHADLFDEIGKLETWLADIAKRQSAAKAPVTSYA